MMRDGDVRPLVLTHAAAHHQGARVLPEVGLKHGLVRVDVLALSASCLHGYEIKADADTLKRLPGQVAAYSEALDRCALVVGAAHPAKAVALLPEWWGVVVVTGPPEALTLEEVRPAQANPAPDAFATACLLWRDEALALLESAGAARGMRNRSRVDMYQRLAEALGPDALRQRVREVVCARTDWRKAA